MGLDAPCDEYKNSVFPQGVKRLILNFIPWGVNLCSLQSEGHTRGGKKKQKQPRATTEKTEPE